MKKYARMLWYILAGFISFFATKAIIGEADGMYYLIGVICALASDYLEDKYK
jgi:hypothetical protein